MSDSELQFSGSEQFAAAPEVVFDYLTDLDRLEQHLPDLVSSSRTDDAKMECTLRPGLSFLRGTVDLVIDILQTEPPRFAVMRAKISGVGQSMIVKSSIQLQAVQLPGQGDGTRVDWTIDVRERTGLLASVSPTLIKAAAERIIVESFRRVGEKLAR